MSGSVRGGKGGGKSITLTVEDAEKLPDREFRRRFLEKTMELRDAYDIDLEADFPKSPITMQTDEMRLAVVKYQHWYNPKKS
jgi:hypothetical protein